MKIDLGVIHKSSYTVEEIFAFIKVEFNRVGQPLRFTSENEPMYLKFVDDGLLSRSSSGLKLTKSGKDFMFALLEVKYKAKVVAQESYNFEEFWELFPPTDKHGMWLRTRALRSDKARSKTLYDRAIESGTLHTDIIKALKWEIAEKKKMSTTSNKMSFMKASVTWLHQREYELILEELSADDSSDTFDDNWTTDVL